jgi:hypothetical protein
MRGAPLSTFWRTSTPRDVAVLHSSFEGYELKSDLDRLDRLEHQVRFASEIFHRFSVVTTLRYADRVTEIAPAWCGVFVAVSGPSAIELFQMREPVNNPTRKLTSALSLLWQSEVHELACEQNIHTRSASKAQLIARAQRRTINEVRSLVTSAHELWPQTQIDDRRALAKAIADAFGRLVVTKDCNSGGYVGRFAMRDPFDVRKKVSTEPGQVQFPVFASYC